MSTTTTLTLPTVHMNGTGFKDLWHGYENADQCLYDLQKSFGQIEFNARDYYVQGPDAYTKARDERNAINRKIRDVKEYIDAHRLHLDSQRPPLRV